MAESPCYAITQTSCYGACVQVHNTENEKELKAFDSSFARIQKIPREYRIEALALIKTISWHTKP